MAKAFWETIEDSVAFAEEEPFWKSIESSVATIEPDQQELLPGEDPAYDAEMARLAEFDSPEWKAAEAANDARSIEVNRLITGALQPGDEEKLTPKLKQARNDYIQWLHANENAKGDVSEDRNVLFRGVAEGLQQVKDTATIAKDRGAQIVGNLTPEFVYDAFGYSKPGSEADQEERFRWFKQQADARNALHRELNSESDLPPVIANGIFDAASTLTQAAPAAAVGAATGGSSALLYAQYGISTGNEAWVESGGNIPYTLAMVGAELGAMAAGTKLANKLGAKRVQDMVTGGKWKIGLKEFLKGQAIEQTEEQATLLMQSIAGKVSEVDPESFKDYGQKVVSTAVATFLAGGMAGIPSATASLVERFTENPSRTNAKKLGVEKAANTKAAREDLAEELVQATGGAEVAPIATQEVDTYTPTKIHQAAAAGDTGDVVASGSKFVRTLKKWFRSGGLKNKETKQLDDQRHGYVAKHASLAEYASKDLMKAAKKEYKKVTPEIAEDLDAALKDPRLMRRLPQDIQIPLRRMRDHIDNLSREIQRLPDIQGSDLELSIDENLRHYVTRTYKKFENDRWAKQALNDPDIMADFANHIRQPSPKGRKPNPWQNLSDQEIQTLAARMLQKDTSILGDESLLTPASREYVNVLKKRKNLPTAVRQLYGENVNAFVNYVTSVEKMSRLLANNYFVDGLRQTGLRDGFFSTPEDLSNPRHTTTVNPDLKQLKPLQGMLMEPEMAEALNEIYTSRHTGPLMNAWVGAMAYTKAAKTIQSVTATARNLIGGAAIMVRNGSLSPTQIAKASKLTWYNDLLGRGRNQKTAKEWARLAGLGLTHGVTIDELRSMAKQSVSAWESFAEGNPITKTAVKGTRALAKAYQSMDAVRKIAEFYDLRPQYREAFPNMSNSELDRYVADIIHDIDPTYDRASRAVRTWSRYVPLGPFVTFNAEIFRTSVNHAKITLREIKSDNPKLRKLGYKKLVGAMVAYAGPTALAHTLNSMHGVDDEELEDIRKRVAPWSRNSDLIVYELDRENQHVGVMDLSYTDPYNIFGKTLNAMARGEPGEAIHEATDFITGEDIFSGGIVSVLRNKDENGRPVYSEGLGADEQISEIINYMLKKVEPGTLTSLKRIRDTDADKKTKEIIAFATGFRASPFDLGRANYYRNREYASTMYSSNSATLRALRRAPLEDLADLLISADTKRKETFDTWHEFSNGTARLGGDAYTTLVTDLDGAKGGSKTLAGQVYTGQYIPYRPSNATLQEVNAQEDGEERIEIFFKFLESALPAKQR